MKVLSYAGECVLENEVPIQYIDASSLPYLAGTLRTRNITRLSDFLNHLNGVAAIIYESTIQFDICHQL